MACPSPAWRWRRNAQAPTRTSLQAAWHAEAADEAVKHIGRVLAGMSHRSRNQRLPFGIGRLVPSHHRRQHHAGSIAMRHVEGSTQHIADAMARAHRHALPTTVPSRARCRSGNPAGRRDRWRRPSPAAAPAPASKALSAPAHRRKDALRLNKDLRRNDRRRGFRSRAIAIAGVCTVTAGSRITASGITPSWRSISLTLVRWLVTPATALNSPPAMVVGTLIWRTAGGDLRSGATPLCARILSISATVRMSLARHN